MRAYSEAYLSEVVETQGKLFDYVAYTFPDADTEHFIIAYMASKTRKSIDEAKAYVNTMDAKDLWEYFLKIDKYNLKPGKALKGFMTDWIGEFYAYYQWYYNIPSAEIIKTIPLSFLTKAYHGLHDLELDLAVKKVGNTTSPIICFHNPDEENGYLSNWYHSFFYVKGIMFSSMEQYMMYCKATCFNDLEIARQILETSDVAKIKSLGRLVKNYDDNHWNGVRQIVVYDGLYAKFMGNEEIKAKLLATGNSFLAECAVRDTIWGIGLSMHDPNRFDRTKWKGQNLLGYTLMMVRNKLAKS